MIGFICDGLYTLAVCIGAFYTLAPAAGIEKASILALCVTLLIAFVPIGIKNLGTTGRIVIAGAIFAFVLGSFLLLQNDRVYEAMSEHMSYLWLIPVGLGSFAAGELMLRYRPVRIICALCVTVILTVCDIQEYPVQKPSAVAAFMLILIVLTVEIQHAWHREGDTDSRSRLAYLAPFLIVTVILVALSPAPDSAYDWPLAKRIYRFAYEKIREIDIRINLDRSYDPTEHPVGFSGRGSLPGEIRQQDTESMIISGIPSDIRSIKLTGKTFNSFMGRDWVDTDEQAANDVMLDTLLTRSSVDAYTDTPQDIVRKTDISIRYIRLNTAYVFAPLKPFVSSKKLSILGADGVGGDLKWPRPKNLNTEYEISYYHLNTENEIFDDYLRNTDMPSRDEYEDTLAVFAFLGEDVAGYTYEDLLRHRDHVIDTYSEAPVLSGSMRTYMDEVYSDAADIYDRMGCLENMLRGLEYNDHPGELPDEVDSAADFLDYFILENRQGYCSHFATAFVLLARAEGLPARYVQGYIVSPKGQSSVTVRSSMAHSWPEVYFDGVGWVAYEPTPIYETGSYWRTRAETEAMYADAASGYPVMDHRVDETETEAEDTDEDDEIYIPWAAIIISVLAGLIFMIALFALLRLISHIRYSRLGERARFEYLCSMNLYLLRLLGTGIEDFETLREYRLRLDPEYTDAAGFIPDYEEYLYGGHTDITKAVERAEKTRTVLIEKFRKMRPVRALFFTR